MRTQRLGITLLVLLACGAAAAQADGGSRGYVFGGMGVAKAKVDCSNTTVCDGQDVALQFGAGAWLPWSLAGGRLAVEGRWAELGRTRLANASLAVDLGHEAQMLGAAWHRPLDALRPGLALVLGGGAARVSSALAATPAGGGSSSGRDAHVTGYGLLGLQHALGGGTTLQAQALFTRMRYDSAGLNLGGGRVGLFTLGVSQRF